MSPSSDAILVINAGSSSVKFAVYERVGSAAPARLLKGQIENIPMRPRFVVRDAAGMLLDERHWPEDAAADHAGSFAFLMAWLADRLGSGRLVAAGHRVVHGGADFAAPLRIDEEVFVALQRLVPLAPLHQPHNLAGIAAIARLRPELPQIACFDTAFHRRRPSLAQTFGLPRHLTENGVQRYGFHGLSYESIAETLTDHDPALAKAASSSPISAMAPACAPLRRG
jgi:acetate kinase